MNKQKLLSLKENLPPYPGINGIKDMYVSAVLVLITEIEGEFHYIFEKRKTGIRQGGEICFPGGGHDHTIDNSLIETAKREASEELGIDISDFHVIGNLNTLVSPLGTVVYAYLAEIDQKVFSKINPNLDEVESIFTLPVNHFLLYPPQEYKVQVKAFADGHCSDLEDNVFLPVKKLGLPDIYSQPWGGAFYKVYVYPTEYGTIWGITSRFIFEMSEYLKLS